MKRIFGLSFILLCSVLFVISGCAPDYSANEPNVNGKITSANDDTPATKFPALKELREFDLEIDFENRDELEMEYHSRGEFPTAEIERRTAEGREEVKGEAALAEIEELIQQISLHSELLPEEAIEKILAYLNISKEEVRTLELEVDFKKGDKIKGDI